MWIPAVHQGLLLALQQPRWCCFLSLSCPLERWQKRSCDHQLQRQRAGHSNEIWVFSYRLSLRFVKLSHKKINKQHPNDNKSSVEENGIFSRSVTITEKIWGTEQISISYWPGLLHRSEERIESLGLWVRQWGIG